VGTHVSLIPSVAKARQSIQAALLLENFKRLGFLIRSAPI
jgi:hypothetical protein